MTQRIKPKPTNCPKCGSTKAHRCRRTAWERCLSVIAPRKAFRCTTCSKRFTQKA